MSKLNVKPISPGVVKEAALILKNGGLVVGPSRTNYNIICDPMNAKAIDRVFKVKKRTKFGPLTVAISTLEDLQDYVIFPKGFDRTLLTKVWPSELTLIFQKRFPFPANLTCGAQTLGITWQGESPLQSIIEQFGGPLAVTSANLSGKGGSIVAIDKAIEDIGAKVELIIDGQSKGANIHPEIEGNTIIDFTFREPYLVRKGVVPVEKLAEAFPTLNVDTEEYKDQLYVRIANSAQRRV